MATPDSFYGRVVDRRQFQFDRIYASKQQFDEQKNSDNVYVGRFVLVQDEDKKYNNTVWQKIEDTENSYILVAFLNGDTTLEPALETNTGEKNRFIQGLNLKKREAKEVGTGREIIEVLGTAPPIVKAELKNPPGDGDSITAGLGNLNTNYDIKFTFDLPSIGNAVKNAEKAVTEATEANETAEDARKRAEEAAKNANTEAGNAKAAAKEAKAAAERANAEADSVSTTVQGAITEINNKADQIASDIANSEGLKGTIEEVIKNNETIVTNNQLKTINGNSILISSDDSKTNLELDTGKIDDVYVNGKSVVEDKIANISLDKYVTQTQLSVYGSNADNKYAAKGTEDDVSSLKTNLANHIDNASKTYATKSSVTTLETSLTNYTKDGGTADSKYAAKDIENDVSALKIASESYATKTELGSANVKITALDTKLNTKSEIIGDTALNKDGENNSITLTETADDLYNLNTIYSLINPKKDENKDGIDEDTAIPLTDKSLEKLKEVFLNAIYPLGSIYMSTSPTSPASIFGGSWQRWGEDRVVISRGNNLIKESSDNTNYTFSIKALNLPKHGHGALVAHDLVNKKSSEPSSNISNPKETSQTGFPGLYPWGRENNTTDSGITRVLTYFTDRYGYFKMSSSNGIDKFPNNPNTRFPMLQITGELKDENGKWITELRGLGEEDIQYTPTAVEYIPPYITCYMWKRVK